MGIRDFPYARTAGIWVAIFMSVGCAAKAVPSVETSVSRPIARETREIVEQELPVGVYHQVKRGQTLWRIAQSYDISMERLIEANGIDDPAQLETGSRVWIPGAARAIDVAIYRPAPESAPVTGEWIWPVPGGRVISPYGAPRRTHRHGGVDIGSPAGEKVLAARDGRVIYSAAGMRGYGKTIILDHGRGLQSLYAHNSQLLVSSGDWVRQGEPIARVGRTGNATTEHCHFEIRVQDRTIDPMTRISPQQATAR